MARVTRAVLHEADPTYLWKLILRTLSILLAGIAIGLIAWAELHPVVPNLAPPSNVPNDPNDPSFGNSGSSSYYYQDYYGDSFGYTPDNYELPWEYISLGLSIIWNFANIGVWFTPSRSGRGMHPGANVGCDLVLWLILLLTGIFASFAADGYISQIGLYLDGITGDTVPDGSSGSSSDPNAVNSNSCSPFTDCNALDAYYGALRHKGIVIAVGIAFTFLVMLFHFALFISACRYTHARRHQHGGRYAKAITDEATVLATKMVRDMGYPPPPGPVPMTQAQQPPVESATAAPAPAPFRPVEGTVPPLADRDVYEPYRISSVLTSEQQSHTSHSDANGKGKQPERDLDLEAGVGSSAPEVRA